jgi:phage terminase small subunit
MKLEVEIDENAKAEFGPCMQALTPKRRAFVLAYLSNGGEQRAAAKAAGYSNGTRDYGPERAANGLKPDYGVCDVVGSQLMRDEKVLSAIEECARLQFRGLIAPAIEAAKAMLRAKSHPKHADTVLSILSRLGYGERSEQAVAVTHTDRRGEVVIERIRELAAKHGLDADQLLGGGPVRQMIEAKAEIEGVVTHGDNMEVSVLRDDDIDAPGRG